MNCKQTNTELLDSIDQEVFCRAILTLLDAEHDRLDKLQRHSEPHSYPDYEVSNLISSTNSAYEKVRKALDALESEDNATV